MTLPEPGKAGGAALKMDKVIKGHPCSPERADRQPKMLAGKQNDEKLAIKVFIVGVGLIVYHFW